MIEIRSLTGCLTAIFLCLSCPSAALAQSPAPAPQMGAEVDVPGGRARLTFSDEFDGAAIDRTKWATNYTNVLTGLPGELEIYTPDSFDVAQGVLKIRSEARKVDGFNYTSGAMTTFGSFDQAYGYFEMRAKVPRGAGLWPAFWMLPQDKSWPPEIDIMEFLGKDPQKVYTTYHFNDDKGQKREDGGAHVNQDWSADFHTFGVQWKPDLLVWYIDGKEVKRLAGSHVPKASMFLLLNLAVGGSWPGPPNRSTPFPASYEVDYVRAYQYNDAPPQPKREWRYLMSTASQQVVKAGQQVTFLYGLENNVPLGDLHVQAHLVDSTGKRKIGQNDQTAAAIAPGQARLAWTFRLPSDLNPGLYVLSLGVFNKDWRQLDWLNNATTILVQ